MGFRGLGFRDIYGLDCRISDSAGEDFSLLGFRDCAATVERPYGERLLLTIPIPVVKAKDKAGNHPPQLIGTMPTLVSLFFLSVSQCYGPLLSADYRHRGHLENAELQRCPNIM